jgi:hypothetical protein
VACGRSAPAAALEVCSQVGKAADDDELSRAAFHFAFFEFPSVAMRNEDGVEANLQGGVDVAAGTIANHPGVGLHHFELADDALVSGAVLFGDDFDGFEMSLQAGFFHLSGLFSGFALGEQDEPVMAGEVGEGFGDAVHDVGRGVFNLRDEIGDPLDHFAFGSVASKLHVSFFEGPAEAADAVTVLADIAALGFIEDVAAVFGRVAERVELGNEGLDGGLKENVVFPEGIVGVDEEGLAGH